MQDHVKGAFSQIVRSGDGNRMDHGEAGYGARASKGYGCRPRKAKFFSCNVLQGLVMSDLVPRNIKDLLLDRVFLAVTSHLLLFTRLC
jgi:hypothetical protein